MPHAGGKGVMLGLLPRLRREKVFRIDDIVRFIKHLKACCNTKRIGYIDL
jgi:hypothetical protein